MVVLNSISRVCVLLLLFFGGGGDVVCGFFYYCGGGVVVGGVVERCKAIIIFNIKNYYYDAALVNNVLFLFCLFVVVGRFCFVFFLTSFILFLLFCFRPYIFLL